MISEFELVDRCKKNDRKAQALLYEMYKSRLMGICMRYANDRSEADDIFQDSFIKIFKNIDTLNNPSALESWIKRIVINTAINHVNRKKYLDDIAIYENQFENNELSKIIDAVGNEELVKLIEELPYGYRLVFNLYVIDGYSHKEIAEMLDISENTSKTQLFKAKARLKESLKKMGIEKYERNV